MRKFLECSIERKFINSKLWFAAAIVTTLFALSNPIFATDSYFDSNGVKIRYVTEGTGEAVVLIHGWMSDSSMWGADEKGNTKLGKGGTNGFQLIALDCRGHGKSDKPHDSKSYGTEMAADVVRLLDHLKIKKAHLVGYSSGAFIAGKVAATHPKRVLSITYGGQAPVIAEDMKPTDFSQTDAFYEAVNSGIGLGEYIISITPPDKPKPTAEQATAIANYLYGGKDVKAFALAGNSFKELKVTAQELKKYKAPILFIHGGNESNFVKNKVAVARKTIGRGEVYVVEGGDHMTTLIKPTFATALVKFLQFGTLNSTPQNAQNKQDEEVIAIVKQAVAAQENYDPATLEKIYASDYIEISPKGEIDEREKAIGFYKVPDVEAAKAKTPKYILDEFKVRHYKNYAMVISRFSIGFKNDATKAPSPVGLVVYALRKEKGEWKIYSAQFTPFPPPRPQNNK